MEILLRSHPNRTRQKVQRDHYWYDTNDHKMLHLVGGQLKFAYDANNKRMKPYVVDSEEWVNGNNYDAIEKWIAANKNKYDIEVINKHTNYFISIDIPDQHVDDVAFDLYAARIEHDA